MIYVNLLSFQDLISSVIQNCTLEELDIGNTSEVDSYDMGRSHPRAHAVTEPFHRYQPSLKKVSLGHVSIGSIQIVLMVAGARNITHLDLNGCAYAVWDPTLMVISSENNGNT